jgi:DNA-directed RNA polymerase specialized sigma24 family protein
MEIGESTMKKEVLSFTEYMKIYDKLIKYFINIRISKETRSNYLRTLRDDCYQEVALKIWHYMNKHPDRNLKFTTLHQVVTWTINRVYRKEHKKSNYRVEDDRDYDFLSSRVSETFNPLDVEKIYRDVIRYIRKVPNRTHGRVLFLRYVLEEPYVKIAMHLNINKSSAKVIYCRQLKLMKEYVKEVYNENLI